MTDRLLSAVPVDPADLPPRPVRPGDATDPAWQLPAVPPRDVPPRLRLDRGRPYFSRWPRCQQPARRTLDDRD